MQDVDATVLFADPRRRSEATEALFAELDADCDGWISTTQWLLCGYCISADACFFDRWMLAIARSLGQAHAGTAALRAALGLRGHRPLFQSPRHWRNPRQSQVRLRASDIRGTIAKVLTVSWARRHASGITWDCCSHLAFTMALASLTDAQFIKATMLLRYGQNRVPRPKSVPTVRTNQPVHAVVRRIHAQ